MSNNGGDFLLPSLLKWIGNKQKFASTIISYMPENFANYYEPFLGSGAVLGELLYQARTRLFPCFGKAYGSDTLPFLIDIFNIVKNTPETIENYYSEQITKYYCSPETVYEEIRQRFNANHNAFDFCLLSRTCYSGIIRFRKADGYMSTPRGPHKPISPEAFRKRVQTWADLINEVGFDCMDYRESMVRASAGDLVYCDPPYTHSQTIIYGSQDFKICELWDAIEQCKQRGVFVMLSINGTRESKSKNISVDCPEGLFAREILIDCGTSMIDRLQNAGNEMANERVHDKLLLTW